MKIISWNVNGLRSCLKKNFFDVIDEENPDILCLQEIKASHIDIESELKNLKNYEIYINSAARKGYSGVAVFSKVKPNFVSKKIDILKYDVEGRILRLDFDDFILFNVYFPNGGMNEDRLNYKLDFYRDFFEICNKLKNSGKNLVICGDYNTAHKEIDLARPKANKDASGFLQIERDWIDKIEQFGYVDTFRVFDQAPNNYTWWSYKFKAREKNIGWRIDYFFVNAEFMRFVKKSSIMSHIFGSDHCPICLDLNLI